MSRNKFRTHIKHGPNMQANSEQLNRFWKDEAASMPKPIMGVGPSQAPPGRQTDGHHADGVYRSFLQK